MKWLRGTKHSSSSLEVCSSNDNRIHAAFTNYQYAGNSGIGFELAAQLMAKGAYHIILGARSSEKGTAAINELHSRNPSSSAELLLLDVTQDDSIEAAANKVERDHGRLDILVNNAAIASQGLSLREQMRLYFDTNATGPAVMTSVFLRLLKKSASARIVNVSSGGGSITRRLDPSGHSYKISGAIPYRASKSALNMITACQFAELTAEGIKVLLYNPGFAVSNLGPQNQLRNGAKPTSQAVEPLVDVVEGKRDHEAGSFLHATGTHPW